MTPATMDERRLNRHTGAASAGPSAFRDFAVRHEESFAALCRHIKLDYFGIDCAELPDGRLLVFELDVAMVVHNMDDPIVYPYKQVAMRKLFDGFVDAIRRRAGSAL